MSTNYSNIRNQLLSNIANTLNKKQEELVPWTDYDPITVDNACWRYISESKGIYNNWTGD